MIGGVTRQILPHLPVVPHLHVTGPKYKGAGDPLDPPLGFCSPIRTVISARLLYQSDL